MIRTHVSHSGLHRSHCASGNLLAHEYLDGRKVHRFVDQNIGAFGHLRDSLQRDRIARKRNRPVGEVKPICKCRRYRWMLHQCRSDFDVVVLHDRPGVRDFLHFDHLQRGNAEILCPEIDRRLGGAKVVRRHLHKWGRSIRTNCLAHARCPTDDQQWPIFNIMVRVMVGDKNRAQRAERDACVGVLIGHPETAIQHVSRLVMNHQIRGHAACETWNRA